MGAIAMEAERLFSRQQMYAVKLCSVSGNKRPTVSLTIIDTSQNLKYAVSMLCLTG
jgi:hypothetical protein